jgi:hypothetical protein
MKYEDMDNYAVVLSGIRDRNLLRITLLELTNKYNDMEHECASLKVELDQIITYMSEIQRSTMAYGRYDYFKILIIKFCVLFVFF